jgi:hypothetical protein
LTVREEPVAERVVVDGRIVGVDTAQRLHGQRERGTFSRAEERIAHQRAGQVERGREIGAAQPGALAAGRQHGDREPGLQRDQIVAVDPTQQFPVGGAAAQEHVLAVVDHDPVAGERVRRAAEAAPRLEQSDGGAGRGAVEGRGDPGQAPAHDDDSLHVRTPARLRAASHAFSHGGSEIRRCRISSGSRCMRSRIRR